MAWLDVYVLCARRDLETVARFRERWLDGMSEAADDYSFPQFAAPPAAIFASPWALCERLVREPAQPYAIYWTAGTEGTLRAAMLFFTSDGSLIAGLSLTETDPGQYERALNDLAASLGGRFGMTLGEAPPAERAADFVTAARAAKGPRLVDGEVQW